MNEDIFLRKLFEPLSLHQKYAYIVTLEYFLTYVHDKDSLIGLVSLIEMNETMLNVDPDEAIAFFEEGGTILGPLDYLAEIKDKVVLNSLMFSCRVIVSVASGTLDGQDCRVLAHEHFNDWFHQLGFSDAEIANTTENILKFMPMQQ